MADRLVDNRRTVTERKMLMTFKAGMHASPAFDDNAKHMPAIMENVDIDHDGRLKLRKGHRSSILDVSGTGTKLGVFHHIGLDDPKTIARRLSEDSDWVRAGRRVLVLNPDDSQHRWIDIPTGQEFDWSIEAPTNAPFVNIDWAQIGIDNPDLPSVSEIMVYPTPEFYFRLNYHYAVIRSTYMKLFVKHNVVGGTDFNLALLFGRTTDETEDDKGTKLQSPDYYKNTLDRADIIEPLFRDGRTASTDLFMRVDILDQLGGELETEARRTDFEIAFVGNETIASPNDPTIVDEYPTDDEGEPVDYGDFVQGGSGFRSGWYSFCYTYANDEWGLETAPSPVSKFLLPKFPRYTRVLTPIQLWATEGGFDSEEVPGWANQIKYYAHRGRFAGDTISAKELPFAFSYIGGTRRDDLSDPFVLGDTIYDWRHETVIEPLQSLGAREFKNQPSNENFENMVLHAGRIWAYDRGLNSIRMSHIDGSGVNRYDVFPHNDAALPHSITLEGSWQSLPHKLIQMPRNGGVYVFYRDAIRWVTGKTVLSGMYSPDVGPRTDLDASGGLDGIGSMSRHAIVEMNQAIMFLGSDGLLYSINTAEGLSSEIGNPIQRYLDEASGNDLEEAFITRFKRNMLLYLNGTIYVYDMKYGYWRTYTYDISLTDLVWSRGGISDESKLYGLGNNGTVYLLDENEADDDTEWSITSNWREVPKNTVIKHIFFQHDTPDRPELKVRFDKDGVDGNEFDFTPEQKNLFRTGVNSSHIKKRFRIKVSGTGVPPNMSMVEYE